MTTWPTVTLGEVAHFVRGVTFKPSDVGVGAETVPVMRTKNVQALLDQDDVIRIPKRLVRRPDQFLRVGDTLISSANSWNLVGKCCWVPDLSEQTAIGGFVVSLRPNPKLVYPRFLYHWFASPRIQAEVRGMANSTTNISNLSIGRCEGLPLHLPPIEEQRRIAAILDHADGLVAKSQAGRAMLRSLPTSVFNEIPDLSAAPLVPLSELCRSPDDIKCGPFGTQLNRSEFRDHGVPLWGIKQVNKGFSIATREFVSHETATRLASYGIDPGDIVMTRKGTVGNCAVYPKGWPPGIMHSDLLRIRLDGLRALPEFLSHQLHHSQEVAGQLAKQNSGAVMPGLNVTRLKSLEVRVPSLAVQRTFVGELNAIHALASVWEERGRVLVAAVNTLQARAFSGRL